MRKLVSVGVVLSFLASFLAPAAMAEKAGAPVEAGGKLILFDSAHRSLEKWHDTWDNGTAAGAKIVVEGNLASVTGTDSDRNYGVIYQDIDWDLDKYPFLEVEVLSCNTEWYLVVDNQNFETGYIKVEDGTRQIGKRAYNIRKACGLKGLRHIRLQVGITTNERSANKGLSAQFYSMRLVSHTDAKVIPPPVVNTGSEAEAQESASLGWAGRWDNGGSSGAILAKSSDKTLKLVGTSPDQCYGCVHKNLTVDFGEYNTLEVSLRNITAQMYVIFEGSQFRGGYYRLRPAMTQPGQFVYNFAHDLDYLKGPQSFVCQLGITTDNPQIPNKGQKAEFSTVKLVSKGGIELLAGFVSSQLIAPPPPLTVPQPLASRPLSAEFKKKAESVDKGSLFPLFGEAFKIKPQTIKTEDPVFTETADRLTVANANYEAVFSRQNGAVISLTDKLHNSQVSLGSEQAFLWRLMFKNEDFLNAEEFLAGSGGRFSYDWARGSTLHLNYARGASLMQVSVEFSKQNYFDFSASFKNGEDKIVTAVDMPKLCFDYRKLDRYYFPWGVGVAFNAKFFKDKRQMKTNYPKLFSDFNAWSLRDGGQLAVYLNWADKPVLPTRINVGYSPAKGESGALEHGWVTYIQPKQTWTSQPLRFLLGEQVEVALKKYKKDVKLTSAPLAVDKLGRALFNKITNGVLLKVALDMNRDFEYVKRYMDDLPRGTIVHLVSWWLEGFDHHMPDYWPVDPTYGTEADFKEVIRLAHEKGLVVMPYTNPTFWNPCPTLKRTGGPEVVASRDLKNNVIFETYDSGGTGWATSPRQPDVKKSMDFVSDKFFKEYGIDMLFMDQLGARFIYYDLNQTLGSPVEYSEGWLERCRENMKRGPLYTEQGYDRLIPVMSGFCGLLSFTFPESKDYNSWWGEKTWEYFPLAQYLAHENVLFYHHNLAHEVFADSDKKIAFYMVQGYNLYTARWISTWASQKKWFYIADRLQKAVASKYAGKPLLNFSQPEPQRLYWSAYPDLGILANISDTLEKNVLNHTIAKNGFLATNRSGSFLAGLFSRLYGFRLAKEQYLIIEAAEKKITVQQLVPQNSLLTVPRPAAWALDEAISVTQGSTPVKLVATTPQTITFYTDGSISGPATYTLEYNTGLRPACAVNLLVPSGVASANTGVKVGMEVANLTSTKIENAHLVLSAWLVKRNLPVIDPKAGYLTLSPDQNFKTKSGALAGGGYLSAEFPLEVPSTAVAGDMVWLKGELVMPGPKGQVILASQSMIPVVSPFEITVQPAREKLTADAKTTVDVFVKNNFSSAVKGDLELDLPTGWAGINRRNITVAPGTNFKTSFTVTTPSLEDKKSFELGASFKVDKNITEIPPVRVEVVPMWKIVSLEGIRLLPAGQKSKCVLRLMAQPEKSATGTVVLTPSSGLQLDRRELPFNVPEGGTQYLEFFATPAGNSDQSLTVEVRSQEGTKSFTAEYPVVRNGEARVVSGDLLNRGDHDLILGNSEVEVQALRELGGRILSFYFRKSGANMLYQNYPGIPKIEGDGTWAEYGGINDWFPEGWPGYVWNDFWFAQVTQERGAEASVRMTTQTKNGLKIERILTLPATGRRLKVEYRIKNLADVPRKYLAYVHPDLCPGPERYAGEHHRIVVPTADPNHPGQTQILMNKFIGKIGKDAYAPNQGWALALNSASKDYFLELFDPEQIKQVGVWQDANFYTMELLSKEESLAPGESRGFSITYVVGNNDWKEELK